MAFTPIPTNGNDTINGDAEPDIIDALAGDDIVLGGGGDDQLTGGPGNDRLLGQVGNDRLLGGPGDDRYEVDRSDILIELANEGVDSVFFRDDTFTGTYALAANIENLTMIGRFNNLSAVGNALDNRILGNNTGNDTLDGGDGNDYIQGDFAFFAGSNSFSSNTGADVLRGGAGNDVIWGDQGEGKNFGSTPNNDMLFGDSGDDILYGQAGADMLDGGTGSDTLYGGAGDDRYEVDGADTLIELANEGVDSVFFRDDTFTGTYTLADNIENLTLISRFNSVFSAVGNDLDNRILGNNFGNDTLDGGDGNDYIQGDFEFFVSSRPFANSAGSDVLRGGAGNDVIWGDLGQGREFSVTVSNDMLFGESGDDTLYGQADNDMLDGGTGNDTLYGGAGIDTLVGGVGNDFLDGGTGNDVLDAGAGQNRLIFQKGDGQDIVRGTATSGAADRTGIELVTSYTAGSLGAGSVGIASTEVTLSRTGNDLVIDRNDSDGDSVGDGDGDDSVTVENYFASSATNLYPIHSIKFSDATWSNADINTAVGLGTPPAPGITLIGTGADDVLLGTAGADNLQGLGGNDIINARAGNDTLDGGLGNDMLYGEGGNDTLDGGFDLLPVGKLAELFGADYLPGNDTLFGGSGNDTYLFGRSSRSDRIMESAITGETNQVRFEAGVVAADVALRSEGANLHFYIVGFPDNKLTVVDYFASTVRPLATAVFSDGTVWTSTEFEAAQVGGIGDADRFIRGTDADDILTGPGGNDTIDGKDGVDQISGGDGNDYLLGGAGRDVLLGGNGNDLLNGGGDGDRLLGGAGADTLLGDAGDDFLDGGTGNDVLDAASGQNRLIFQLGDGQDIVRGVTTTDIADRTTIELVKSYAVGSLGSSPVGIASTEVVLTRAGDNLVIDRNDGDDSVTVENYFASSAANLYPIHNIRFSDTAWSNADINARVVAATPPPVSPSPGTTQVGTDGNDVLTGTDGPDNLYGRGGDDYLKGGAGNDFLNGETGRDLLEGGTGDDMLIVDSVLDAITERPGEGTDTVQSYINYQLGGNVENLTLIGNIAISATGNELDNFMTGNSLNNIMLGRTGNDVLYGDGGDDFLNGELGQDQMFGGVGSDTVIVDDAGDYVWEAANEGSDTVQSYISYTLQDNFENLILIGGTGVVANGNALANVIEGNDADNEIDGRGGLDSLMGSGGNDRMKIYTGQERLSGGSGTDTLQFGADLSFLNLAGLAGTNLSGIEAIDMRNGNVSTARFTLDQMLALSTESNTLKIDGDTGDQLQIGTGWQRGTSGTVGYDQYSMTEGGETGVVLVGQNVTVTMGDWMAA